MNKIPVITNLKQDDDLFTFDLENARPSMANALRRIILSEVPTVGFQTENYEQSTLRVIKNTSSLHNEFLLHRMSLIPIHIQDPSSFNPDHFEFELNVKNDSVQAKNITTKDIVVTNLVEGKKEPTEKFFPKNSITGDHILITRLKPNLVGGESETIHIKGTAIKGTGSDNALFSPVCCAIFTNKKDPMKAQAAFETKLEEIQKEKVEPITEQEKKDLLKKFTINESERYYYTDENDEPNQFSFRVESIGVLSPHHIVMKALDILVSKIDTFMFELDRANESENSEMIQLKETDTQLIDGYDIHIKDENHTLGYLVQDSMASMVSNDVVLFSGYMNPHPLQKVIVIRLQFAEGTTKSQIVEEIKQTMKLVNSYLRNIRDNIAGEFGGDMSRK